MKAPKKNFGEKKDEKERNDNVSKNRTLFQALLRFVTACAWLRSIDGASRSLLRWLSIYKHGYALFHLRLPSVMYD